MEKCLVVSLQTSTRHSIISNNAGGCHRLQHEWLVRVAKSFIARPACSVAALMEIA